MVARNANSWLARPRRAALSLTPSTTLGVALRCDTYRRPVPSVGSLSETRVNSSCRSTAQQRRCRIKGGDPTLLDSLKTD